MLKFSGLSDVGKKRSENEDRFHLSRDKQYSILADGMGGRLFGEVASSMAVEQLAHHVETDLPYSIARLERAEQSAMLTNLLDEWIRDVNVNIWRKGVEEEKYREMGTTLVCMVGLESQVVLAHVGDSRCYRLSKGKLEQLTEDHSFVNSQVKQGVLTEEEAKESNQRNIITRAVGTAEKVKPEIRSHDAHAGDRFLLCSDGLTDMVPDERIQEFLAKEQPLDEIAQELVDAANAAGGRDNITVILAEFGA